MLQSVLTSDPQYTTQQKLDSRQAQIWTSMPGIIESVNFDEMICDVIVAIQGINYIDNGKGAFVANAVNMPKLLDCPLSFLGANDCIITTPVKKGTECVIIFFNRCMDAWWDIGAYDGTNIIPRPQLEFRMHDLSDGIVIPGIRSKPNVVPHISTTDIQIRSNDVTGTTPNALISLNPVTHNITINSIAQVNVTAQQITTTAPTINVNASTALNITSPITTFNGNIKLNGSMASTGDIVAGTISLENHEHMYSPGPGPAAPCSPPIP